MQIGPYVLKNPWILAPMAGVSEMPFRVLARRFGASAAPTELVSAKGLIYGQARTQEYLRHDVSEDPFWVQLFGGDIESMVAGAIRATELGAKIIDINMGCPVRKVTRHGAGSGLLCDPERAQAMVAAMVKATGVPITVKIRAGWDAHTLHFAELAKRLEDAGCAAIAMHARTRTQGYSGHANWDLITALVQAVKVPVIGNGDAFTAEAAQRMQAQTGCAAVMLGRGVLGDPWVFARLTGEMRGVPTPAARWKLVHEHLQAHLQHVGDATRGIRRFRPHLMWYARGLTGAASFRNSVTTIDDLAELLQMCEAFFTGAGKEQNMGADEEIDFDVGNALG